MFDVKTGLLMFTVRRRVSAERGSNVWYRDDKLEELQAKLATDVSGKLASDVRRNLFRYARATKLENERLVNNATPENDNEKLTQPVATANENSAPPPPREN